MEGKERKEGHSPETHLNIQIITLSQFSKSFHQILATTESKTWSNDGFNTITLQIQDIFDEFFGGLK